jgi:uncharacterized protein (TIGR02217 family)
VSFFEVEFPTTLSYHAVGGPTFSTTVNPGFSGQEQRNKNWSRSRGKWNVSLQTPAGFANRQQFVDLLYAFFCVVAGKGDAFRLKDHKDFKATSQALVTYNSNVQLAITRTIGGRSYQQIITKPITSNVHDYQGNALANSVFLAGTTTPVTVDYTTGIVTGQSAGTLVDFKFHYPVRFDTDELQMVLQALDSGKTKPIIALDSIQLIEVQPPNY